MPCKYRRIAVPAAIFFSDSQRPPSFIGTAILFLPLFFVLPELIQRDMKADSDSGIAFGKMSRHQTVLDQVCCGCRAGVGDDSGAGAHRLLPG
jgi:hypothetical protein